MSAAFTEALNLLGPSSAAWSTVDRGVVRFRHPLFPAVPELGTMPEGAAHFTYGQVVVLEKSKPTGESILTPGQSGFIGLSPSAAPVFGAHYSDQLPLYANAEFKPMPLYKNATLDE